MKNKQEVKQAIKDILWMARRYADGRKTYAPHLFNEAYDTLRDEFGDEIDPYKEDEGMNSNSLFPYAMYGDNPEDSMNLAEKERKGRDKII